MSKRFIVLLLTMQAASIHAEWYKPWTWVGPKLPVDHPGNFSGGFATKNLVTVSENVYKTVDACLKDPKAVQETACAATHGATYGLLSGTASAVRDGVVAHPYAAGAVAATGVAVAGYRTFRPLSAKEKAEEAKAQGDVRAAELLKLSDDTADEYRTCLNTHARSAGTCDDKLRRCHSPARRLALLNHKRASAITTAFREYQ